LQKRLGKAISDEELRKSIDIYNENRSALAQLYALRRDKPHAISGREVLDVVRASMCMRKEEHTALLKDAVEELRAAPTQADGAVRLVLFGNVCDDPGLMHLFEELETVVVDDDLCVGSRYFLHIESSDGDPVRRLAQRYLRRVPCPSKHSSDFDRRKYLVNMVKQSRADGIVMLFLKFCDPHAFDYPDLAKRLSEENIPHLVIETEIQPASLEQTRTRLQAFVEMLKEKKHGR
jgi:benzoyl-CoA reductase/2-hydroxyglutaryl-CoA dehydratase subunit BcrC/BadD/HgdB